MKRPAGSCLQVALETPLGSSSNLIGLCSTCLLAASLAWSMLTIATGIAWSQVASPPSSPNPPSEQTTPDRAAPPQGEPAPPAISSKPDDNPGLLDGIGKMFEKSLSIFPPLKSPGETLDDLNARAKDAADTLSRLARPTSIATGRMICPSSVTGAPDCKSAAEKLCQAKGFKEGKSLTIDSVEACSARVLIPGRTRRSDDCRTDNYVTRALCQ